MIKRELYLSQIRPFMDTNIIKVMTGIRRSGKSTLLDLIKEELKENGVNEANFISMNFEKMEFSEFDTATKLNDEILRRAKGKDKVYLFLDEIQHVKDFELCVNSLRVSINCDIYLTGSNATLLSKELATHLSGRYVQFVVYPLSFKEFIDSYDETIMGKVSTDEAFNLYLKYGGMPSLREVRYDDNASNQLLEYIYTTILYTDIVKRYEIRDVDLFERIISYIMINVGCCFSANSISKYFKSEGRKVSTETILNYLKYCAEAYLIYPVKRDNLIGKQVLKTNEKYYIADHGFREAIYANNLNNIEVILENIVFLEALRRGYKVNVGIVNDKQIDFVLNKKDEKIYLQVCYLLASAETIKREFSSLEAITDNYAKYVISMDPINMSQNGIIHKNIKDFLLQDKW